MQELRCADTVCVKIKAICAFRRQEKFFKCIEYRSGDVTSPCLPISGSKQRTWPSIRGDSWPFVPVRARSCPFVSVRARSCPFVPVRARSLISDTAVGVALPLAVGPRLSPLRPRPRPRIWPRPRRMLPAAGIVVCLAPVPVSPSLLSEPESLLSGSLELSVSFLRVWDWVDVLSARRAVSASKPTKSSPESESAYSSRKPAAMASLSSAIIFRKRRRHVQKSQKTAEYLYWNL